MNFYNVTEKSLKRFLKSKIKITTATVVGFLIAGSLAFANATPITDISKDIIISESLTGDSIVNVDYSSNPENDNKTITNNGIINGIDWSNKSKNLINVKLENDDFTFINNGKINEGEHGVNYSDRALNIVATGETGNINISNFGEVKAKNYGIFIKGNNPNNINLNLNNSGLINTHNVGVYLGNVGNIALENNGNITVGQKSGMFATGIHITGNSNGTIKNNNNISVNAGIKYDPEPGRVGIAVSGIKVDSGKDTVVNVINDGTISLGEDTQKGIGIFNNSKGTTTNNGVISFKYNGTGNKAISVENGTGINNGIIQLSDVEKEKDVLNKEEVEENIFGNVTNNGMIVDKNGIALFTKEEEVIGGEATSSGIKESIDKNNGAITVGQTGVTITTTDANEELNLNSFKVQGTTTIKNNEGKNLTIASNSITLDANGKFVLENGANLTLKDGVLTKAQNISKTSNNTAIENAGTLNLENMTINGDIIGDKGNINIIGNNILNGTVAGKELTITKNSKTTFNENISLGKISNKSEAYYASNVTMIFNYHNTDMGTVISGGTNIFEVGANGENALLNTSNKLAKPTGVDSSVGVQFIKDANIKLDISNIEQDMTIDLGNSTLLNGSKVELTKENGYFYDLIKNDEYDNKYNVTFKQNLASTNGYSSELDGIMNASQKVNGLLSDRGYNTLESRIALADKIYAGNLYSETIKAAYNNTKLIEDGILSLNTKTKVGEWTANGKAIYDKNEYDRQGTIKNYSSEVESSGLMATLEYGLNETTSTGVVFAGVKQDITSEIGTADGEAFYLGLFANKELGNNKFTLGLGYQLDKLDATNDALGGGDKYDSSAVNVYAQAKHIAKFDGITFEPKVKVGYTYVDQDEVKDGAMKLESQDMNTFDVTVGVDLVKEISLEKSNLRLVAGTSFTKLFGDIDDKYKGSFYGASGEKSFDVMGADLTENSLNFTLGAEVENENGFFYNVGASYTMGSNNTDNYGANIGIGYRF